MYDGIVETVEQIWVSIWCMLDGIAELCHKTETNTLTCYAEHCQRRIYIREAEITMDVSQAIKE